MTIDEATRGVPPAAQYEGDRKSGSGLFRAMGAAGSGHCCDTRGSERFTA
jgi:hypothetical protein